jgi:hypothetical protein
MGNLKAILRFKAIATMYGTMSSQAIKTCGRIATEKMDLRFSL